MVTSVAPGPGLGFPTHLGGSNAMMNNGLVSFDLPPSEVGSLSTRGSSSINQSHTHESATHLSGARMHLMLPQRYQEEDISAEGLSTPTDGGSNEPGHRRGGSFAASRARAQTVSDQTRLRTYPSISASTLDDTQPTGTGNFHNGSNGQTPGYNNGGDTPQYLTAYPTPQISPSATKRGITLHNTDFTAAQLNPSLSGLGWEATIGTRPESPLPLPSPMALAGDQPGSHNLFLRDKQPESGNSKPHESLGSSAVDNPPEDRKISIGSKTSAFFATSFGDGLPTPPRPLGASVANAAEPKTITAMSSCSRLDDRTGGFPSAEGKHGTTMTPSTSRNSIFDTADKATILPTRNRQRSGLGIGASPARRTEIPRLNDNPEFTMADEEPMFSEFSSLASRRATLSAAGVNRARSLNESSRRKSNAIFETSYALPPPPRSPTVAICATQKPLQELPSPAETSSVFTVSPSPSPSTAAFGDRVSVSDSRTSHLRHGTLGIPDSRAVTMPFSLCPTAVPSPASSRLPISPVESSSSVLGSGQNHTGSLGHAQPNSLLSPHKTLTREVSNSNCNARAKEDTFIDQISVKPGDILEPESTSSGDASRQALQSWKLDKVLGEGAFSRVWSARKVAQAKGKDKDTDVNQEEAESEVVAIKMMDKRICKDNDRTRISFEREVAVLKVGDDRMESFPESVG
ncbi:hypothetical protein QFC19_005757 [Naganishia cerealis]|uniref:Uncharacterized protein n=1 Tax=Naganishia cerealis TaxID=610337 RepID=A0ACC2VMD6_9TREE|nr:hypothetical protein QFC19_005757 [Naganishia cerealis]